MGFLDGLGTSLETLIGAKGGANYQPTFPNINEGVSPIQADVAYGQSLDALQKQSDFVNALGGNNALANQNFLADQLKQQSLGQGPNPALQQFQNMLGQNVASQNALMAGQRGAGANAGLIARQAAMQGGNLTQQGAGQSALMQAQQQLSAQQALQQLSASQVGQQAQGIGLYNQAAQSQQQMLLNALAEANKQKVAMQSNINTVGGNLAAQQGHDANSTLGNLATAAGTVASKLDWGKLLGGRDSEYAEPGGDRYSNDYRGGMVKNFDSGGIVDNSMSNDSGFGPRSFVGRFLSGQAGSNLASSTGNPSSEMNLDNPADDYGDNIYGPKRVSNGEIAANVALNGAAGVGGINDIVEAESGFGSTPITVSGGPNDVSGGPPIVINLPVTSGPTDPGSDPNRNVPGLPGRGGFFNHGGAINGEKYAKKMKPVPGKASVKGDSLKNDKVKAMLSPGEIILPRSVTTHQNAPEMAKRFVEAIMAKNGMMKK